MGHHAGAVKLEVGAGWTAIPSPYAPHLDALTKAFRVVIAARTRPEFDALVRIVEPVGQTNALQLGRLEIAIQMALRTTAHAKPG